VAFVLGGLGLRAWSWLSLRPSDSATPEDEDTQSISDAGPYRHLRHPAYAGALIGWFGYGLALTSLPALAAVTVPNLFVYLHVIAKEEAELIDCLGDNYRSYQSQTSGLVPGAG
jgi:protein-S-isoprenylcysteine O-methyltransferase